MREIGPGPELICFNRSSPGLSLPKYLLLLDYTSRVARAGKASLSAEVAPIFERLGTTAEKWTQRVTRLSQIFQGRRITGQFFATTREVLEQLAQRLGKRRLINLTGSGPAFSAAATATST